MENIYRFLFFVLDRKERDSIYSKPYDNEGNNMYIANAIYNYFKYDAKELRYRRTIASIRKLDKLNYAGAMRGQDSDGYNSSTHIFQVKPMYTLHFLRVQTPQILSKNLISNSFLRVLESKLQHNIGVYYALRSAQQRYFTDIHDRNFHLRKDGNLSFLPKGRKSVVNDNGNWDTDGRMQIKFGKGLNKMFASANIDKPLNDTELERLVSAIQADYIFNGSIREVKGSDIVHWYNYKQYAADQYTLSSSCMKHDECQDYLEFYAKNDTVSMIIATNADDKLLGRAIVWHNAELTTEDDSTYNIQFCDRAYGKNLTVQAIVDYAKTKGYVTKQQQDYHSEKYFSFPNGSNATGDIVIPVIPHTYYPYMDTMKSIDVFDYEKARLYNNCDYRDLTGTSGNAEEDTVCDIHGDEIFERDAVWSDWHDGYLSDSEAVWSDHENTYIRTEDAIELNDGQYTHTDNAVEVTYPSGFTDYIHDDNAVCGYVNGAYTSLDGTHDTTYDALANNNVYTEQLCTTTVTFEHDSATHEFTITTALNATDIAKLTFAELMADYDTHEIISNTDDQ